MVLDAGSLDPGIEAAFDVLSKLAVDLMAEEASDMVGLDLHDRPAGELVIERLEGLRRTKDHVSGILNLHQTPMIGMANCSVHRAAARGVAIEDAMQIVWRQAVGKGLCTLPIIDRDAERSCASACRATAGRHRRLPSPRSHARAPDAAHAWPALWHRPP